MPFSEIDAAGITRALSQIADRSEDLADAYFERLEVIELPAQGLSPGLRVRRETGLAVRLVRDGGTWLAGRDHVDTETFRDAVRRVARAQPRASYPMPELRPSPWGEPPEAPEVSVFPSLLQRALRAQGSKLEVRATVRRHRRWVRVLGVRLASATEFESFYSLDLELPWGRWGTLITQLDDDAAKTAAAGVLRAARSQGVEPPAPEPTTCVLGPGATAVLLHEAVAHALETDVLARGSHPEAAIGVSLGSSCLNVFDDPAGAPKPVRRRSDDEGFPTVRRCLLRGGVVEQPLSDALWARRSDLLVPGAGRRGDRHDAPAPRSSHLELVPARSSANLFEGADGGLYFPEVERGRLDPLTGVFTIRFPYGHRIQDQAPGAPVGPCSLRAHLTDLLGSATAVGSETRSAGAGWCAKDGIVMPVWATAPDLRLEGVKVRP
ncbi:MAG: metallopeptidase TldD-related protein [Acidobacteriota bacterium]